ncbi:MAG: gamma-glutamyl-gamma-aminobutyrate hydrolase family protein [Pyramidobacter sp.]|nr:gamma-glutamyl-gamma-aminobutyrate hydrolase family protein [Pyramidobacter sp.]
MGKLIGVVPPAALYATPNSREDRYSFGNNYVKRIAECGGIPLGVLPVDAAVSEDYLDRFDAFLICGGVRNWPYHFQTVFHALNTGKPLLGICLGCQTIHRVFKTLDYMEKTRRRGDLWENYVEYRADSEHFLLERVEDHRRDMIRGRENESKHAVSVAHGSFFHRLTGKNVICGGTFHNFRIIEPSAKLTVSGTAEDGTIEIVEYGEQLLGVQFHPEIDRELMPVFEWLCRP